MFLKSHNSFLWVSFLLVGFQALSQSLNANDKVDPLSFFQAIEGDYKIISSGLNPPKGGTEVGYVTIEENEGLIVLPYCHVEGGVCDPGFRAFPLNNTQIKKDKTESGSSVFTLETVEFGQVRRFLWEDRGGIAYFFDPDYALVSGENFPLEFVIERIQ